MFIKAPLIEVQGRLEADIDYAEMVEIFMLPAEAIVWVKDDAKVRESWVEITPLEYLAARGAGVLSADKTAIRADGLDAATITAEAHPDLTEITFYHADTNEPIATVPVDPATHTATLQVMATTPGVIRIRVGGSTMTKLNEVTIHAVEAS